MPTAAVVIIFGSTFLHAGWNLLVKARRASDGLLRITLVSVALGIVPTLAAELFGRPFPPQVWLYAAGAGASLAVYNLGLTRGYQNGHFSVVYPVARALPILIVAVSDIFRGHAPAGLAWLGMALVLAGCIITPMESLREFRLSNYLNRTMVWIVVTALGTVGYTIIDHTAAEFIPSGPVSAARYGVLEFAFSALFFWLTLLVVEREAVQDWDNSWQSWKQPVFGGLAMFGAYWLILWAYQISPQASYVVALRQFSIVLGVVVGSFLFKEPARGLRISASMAIVGGIALIILGG